ncbi:glycosyltransferase [Sedimentisphaera salicampi]|uniref:glycosyltransferase n=1 Tax=Sedimentisphaera salicampi TaxID=1941349 RepID=UPI000B9B4D3A|nr:glycosyltransferase [Sedimentisphaera salicampi]OXU15575.1 glycosyltransferase, GG-Bacteroidales peptide system [Sedimentisphaera salicampi]
MRVFYCASRHGLGAGGLRYQIIETLSQLSKYDVDIIKFNPWDEQIKYCDLCHFFGNNISILPYMIEAKRFKKKIVLSPVWMKPYTLNYSKLVLWASLKLPGFSKTFSLTKYMFDISDTIIALNKKEKSIIVSVFKQSDKKVVIIPNGCRKYGQIGPDLFKKTYGISNFVLCVGAIQKRKGQLELIKSIEKLPYSLVIIGGGSNDEYGKICKMRASKKVIFIDKLDYHSPLLESAYCAAKVFALISSHEGQPLVFPEAALSGNLLITSNSVPSYPGLEKITYHTSFSVSQISDTVRQVMELNVPKNEIIKVAQNNVLSWKDVAEKILDCYAYLAQYK